MASGRRAAARAATSMSSGGFALTIAGTATATEAPNGQVNLTGDATNPASADKSFPTVPGRNYRLNFVAAGNAPNYQIGTTAGATDIVGATAGALGINAVNFTATRSVTWVRFSQTPASLSNINKIGISLR